MGRVIVYFVTAAFVVLLFTSGSPALAVEPNLITNGSFESGPFPGSYLTFAAGSAEIAGWVVTAGDIDYIGSLWPASEGVRSVDMNGGGPGAIQQTFTTIPGRVYDVFFDMAGFGPTIKTLLVSAAGHSDSFLYICPGCFVWRAKTFTFTATSVSTTLEFRSATTVMPWNGPALDNVRVFPRIGPARPPTAIDDDVTTDEDVFVPVNVAGNDTDPDGDLVPDSASVFGAPDNGTAVSNGDGTITYTPNLNFNGADTFSYQVCDMLGACAVAMVFVTVNPINDAPVVSADNPNVMVDEGQTAANSGSVSDVDGDWVTLTASVGTIVNNGDGTWSWSFPTTDGPTQSQSVTVFADDGSGGMSQTAFNLVVNNVAPMVNAGADAVILSGEAITVNASFADAGISDTHTATIDFGAGLGAQPAAVVQGAGSGTVTAGSQPYYTPGAYTVAVCVSDNDGGTGCDWLNVQVNPVQVLIDIKLGGDNNCINNNGHGVIPVTVFGSAAFDDARIAPATVLLDGMPVNVAGGRNLQAHLEDVNGDGFADLMVQITNVAGVFAEGQTTATLTGSLTDGTVIQGSDAICLVPR